MVNQTITRAMRASLAILLAAAITVACAEQATGPGAISDSAGSTALGVGPDGSSVTGSGHIVFEDGYPRKFSVTAQQDTDGTVRGQAQIVSGNSDNYIHMDIDCMAVFGNTAVLSGVTTHERLFPSGEAVFFAVQDNGKDDLISPAFIGGAPLPNLCELVGIPPAEFLIPVTSGNITVR